MTPKEKAKELIEKYQFIYIPHYTSMFEVKECALIVVDEIINDNPNIYDSDRLNYKYWNQVKEEINKL